MMRTLVFEMQLAGEPVGKGRPRFSRATGHTYTPEKTARFEERLAWGAQSLWGGKPLLESELVLYVAAYFSIPKSKPKTWKDKAEAQEIRHTKKPDIDNVIKGVADSLNKIVYVDDSQIVAIKAAKFYSHNPRIEIKIFKAVDLSVF